VSKQTQDTTGDEKTNTLRATQTLHPHPDRVRDALFKSSRFFDPRDSVQVKYEMLRQVQIEGATVISTIARFGYSRVTWYHSQRRFAQLGLPGLVSQARGPHEGFKLKNTIAQALIARNTEHPGDTSLALSNWLLAQHGMILNARSIRRVIRQAKVIQPKKQACRTIPH
jgi:hypothetical protein